MFSLEKLRNKYPKMKNIIIGNNMNFSNRIFQKKRLLHHFICPTSIWKVQLILATTTNKCVCHHEINFIRLVSAFADKKFVDYVFMVSQQEKCFDKHKTGCQTNMHWQMEFYNTQRHQSPLKIDLHNTYRMPQIIHRMNDSFLRILLANEFAPQSYSLKCKIK